MPGHLRGIGMSDGGKGSAPRPFSVDHNTFSNNWDAIFKKKKHQCNGLCGEYECKENQSTCARIPR